MRSPDHPRPPFVGRRLLPAAAVCSAGLLVLGGCATGPSAQNSPARTGTRMNGAATDGARTDGARTDGTRMNEQLPPAQKGDPGPVRTDLDPLTKRFPALGEPVSATWQSGVLGDEEAPGPASYWIDAVVVLQPAVAESLRARPGLTVTELPQLSPGAAASLPEARWLAAPELDSAFSANGFAGQAFIAENADTVVLLAKGGG